MGSKQSYLRPVLDALDKLILVSNGVYLGIWMNSKDAMSAEWNV